MAEQKSLNTILLILLLAVTGASLIMVLVLYFAMPQDPEEQVIADVKKLAGELSDNNLHQAAVEEYQKILYAFPLNDSERGAINYLIGKIYFEDIGDYEQAAAFYIRARALDENASYYNEAGKNLITCLERLGRRLDARRELDRQTSLEPDSVQTPGKIVARIGSYDLTLADFGEALQTLPAELQDKYSDYEGKKEFLNKLIGRELIYHAALREGLDRDSKIQEDLKGLEKDYLVQYYTQKEILPTIRPDTSGINLYYQAHKAEYGDKPMDSVYQKVVQDYLGYRGQQVIQEHIDQLLEAEPVQTFEENLK